MSKKYQSPLTRLVETMDEVSFEEAVSTAARELERAADVAFVENGLFANQDEFESFANVALELVAAPSMTNEQIGKAANASPEDVVRIRADKRFEIMMELTRLGDAIDKAKSFEALDEAFAAHEKFLEKIGAGKPGVVEFRVLKTLLRATKERRESVRELTEQMKTQYGIEPDEEWNALMREAIGTDRSGPDEKEGKELPFDPNKRR